MAFFIIFCLIFSTNILAYLWAFKNQSDKITDITYSLSFLIVLTYLIFTTPSLSIFSYFLAGMVLFWALRTGGYLLFRIKKIKVDYRFNDMRKSQIGFLKFWLLQSISVLILILPIYFSFPSGKEIAGLSIFGIIVWAIGFWIETVADFQKLKFKSSNSGLLKKGLYNYIQYPNYLGEILVWWGIFIFVIPVLSSYEWLSILSPIWISFLLLKVSGIPLIENARDRKYTNAIDSEYRKSTSYLIPFIY